MHEKARQAIIRSITSDMKLYIIDKIYHEFEQRIKELEEPKTCEGCRFFTQCDDNFNYCDYNSYLNGFVNKHYGCNHYEPK